MAELLTLKPAIDPEGHADSAILLTWCIDQKAMTKALEDSGVLRPFVLVSVRQVLGEAAAANGDPAYTQYGKETKRWIFPLTAMAGYIGFSRPGLNSITACIVWSSKNLGKHGVSKIFLNRDKDSGRYFERIYENYGVALEQQLPVAAYTYHGTEEQVYYGDRNDGRILANSGTERRIEVDAEMFADPLPEWKKQYTAKFFKAKPFDECAGKARRWTAYWVFGLPWLIGSYLIKVVLLTGASFLGYWDRVHARNLWHPLQYGIEDTITDAYGGSRWFHKKDSRELLNPVFWLFNPISNTALALGLFVIGSIKVGNHLPKGVKKWPEGAEHWHRLIGWGIGKSLVMAVLLHLAVAAAVGVILLLLMGIEALANVSILTSLTSRLRNRQVAKRLAAKQKAAQEYKDDQARLAAELLVLNCSPELELGSLDGLPKSKQTLKLRAQVGLKHRHCRPFADS